MLELAINSGLATVTLQRASSGNALASELVESLLETLPRVWSEPGVNTLLLRGEGRHFCTGFDLRDVEHQSDADLLYRFVRIELLLASLWHAPTRTIAIASGRTWGAGADIVACCDIRIASDSTRFRFPGAGFGIVLGTRRLAERVGEDTARKWVINSIEVTAAEAHKSGFVTDVLPVEDQNAWISELRKPRAAPPVVAALHRASRRDFRDLDLASLVRSAAIPGLRQRILTYSGKKEASS
jgi:enoyl-CoA hydratase